MLPNIELMNCQSLAVPAEVMHHVIGVESAFNPYAIGVVGGHLVRQPQNLPEALATVRMLESRGFNFSLGLAQVNRYNLDKYGLGSYERAFQVCPNLQAGSRILAECYNRSGNDWGRTFSCYYSGNFVTGYRDGYVQKIFASMHTGTRSRAAASSIAVVGKPIRHSASVLRHPVNDSPPVALRRFEVSQGIAAPTRAQSSGSQGVRPQTNDGRDGVEVLVPSVPSPALTLTSTQGPDERDRDSSTDTAFVF
nr:lytic transglycosylase domain-containing protein [Pseudomonas corrugata]